MNVFIIIFLLLVLFVLYIHLIESKTVFYPSAKMELTPQEVGLPYEDIYFTTKDGIKLNGWLLQRPKAKATLLFCHGNVGNISGRLEKIKLFWDMGVNVFIFDYRGYGLSEGRPSEEGVYADAQAAYAFLKGREDLRPLPIIDYGVSLGGAIAVDLASKEKVFCLIVDSSFSSGRDMAKIILPIAPSFLIKTKLDSLTKIQKITVPKLFLHSQDDEIVPFQLGKKLFAAAPDPKIFKETLGDHNAGYIQYQDIFVESIVLFLKDLNIL